MIKQWWHELSNLGIYKDIPFVEKVRIRISNQITALTSLLGFIYFLIDFLFIVKGEGNRQPAIYLFHFVITFYWIPILILNYHGFHRLSRILIIFLATALITMVGLSIGQPFQVEFCFFIIAAYVFVLINDWRTIIVIFLIEVIAYLWVVYAILENNPSIQFSFLGIVVRVLIAFSILFFIVYFLQQETDSYQEENEIKNSEISDDRDRMEKLNFTKDKIFSIISHDLRSPIASLQGLLFLVQNDQLSVEEFKKATAGLEKKVHQLSNTLDELLTWSKAQLHGINPHPETISLKPLIHEITAVNKLSARNKKIIITTNMPAEMVVYCDPNMLKSVINNLTTNAIKFTQPGGAISIFCRKENGQVLINVEDTGVGILEENIEKILNPSVHFSTIGTNNEKGTGLGLVMCKEFIAKNNGTFTIKSEQYKGSLFTIALPISAP